MNDNELEQKLRALTDTLRRPDPTPEWKADILSRALREASPIPIHRTLPPRWLMAGWAAAWILVIAMNVSMPQDATQQLIGSRSPHDATPPDVEAPLLIAFQQRQNLNLELP